MTRKWLPLTAICLGTFMLLVDSTIVNTALPRMAVSLDTSFAGLQWVVDAYVVTLACLVLGAGSLADAVGQRRMYGIGLVVFAAASLAAGLAPNAGVLIAARALQGIGAAGMLATTFALLNSAYAGRDRGVAFGIWGAVSGLSAAVGPVLGGLLTQDVGWRSIFFVNLPVSVLALVLTARFLSADSHGASRADVAGTVTFTLAAAALTFGLIRAHEQGWTSTTTLAIFAVAAAALAAFVGVEQRSTHPMLDLALFTRGSFVAVLVASLVVNFSALAYFTYISIWLQSVLDLSPIGAGLVLLPLGVAGFVVSAAVGALGHGWPPRLVIGAGMLLIGAAAVVDLILVTATSTWTVLLPGLVLGGAGVGLATPALAQSAMAAAPSQRAGMASGAVNAAASSGSRSGSPCSGPSSPPDFRTRSPLPLGRAAKSWPTP